MYIKVSRKVIEENRNGKDGPYTTRHQRGTIMDEDDDPVFMFQIGIRDDAKPLDHNLRYQIPMTAFTVNGYNKLILKDWWDVEPEQGQVSLSDKAAVTGPKK